MNNLNIPKSIDDKVHFRSGDGIKWGRLTIEWKEKCIKLSSPNKRLTHVYDACINTKTGDVYLDCRKRKIFVKCLTMCFARPLHILAKIAYHATGAGIVHEVFQAFLSRNSQNPITKKQCFINCAKSLADIVRTPIYGVALMVMNVVAVIIAPLAPRSLYAMREAIGKVEQSMNWGQKHTSFTMARCFQPFFNVNDSDSYSDFGADRKKPTTIKKWKDTDYTEVVRSDMNFEEQKLNAGLVNYVRALIRFRRKTYNCFDQLYGTFHNKYNYESPSYRQHLKKELQEIKKYLESSSKGKEEGSQLDKWTDIAQKNLMYFTRSRRERRRVFRNQKIARKDQEEALRMINAYDTIRNQLSKRQSNKAAPSKRRVCFDDNLKIFDSSGQNVYHKTNFHEREMSKKERKAKRLRLFTRVSGNSLKKELGENYHGTGIEQSYSTCKILKKKLSKALRKKKVDKKERKAIQRMVSSIYRTALIETFTDFKKFKLSKKENRKQFRKALKVNFEEKLGSIENLKRLDCLSVIKGQFIKMLQNKKSFSEGMKQDFKVYKKNNVFYDRILKNGTECLQLESGKGILRESRV